MNIVLYIFTYFFYRTINKRRDAIWNRWTTKVRPIIDILNLPTTLMSSFQEQLEYVESTQDEGNQRLDFRFVY